MKIREWQTGAGFRGNEDKVGGGCRGRTRVQAIDFRAADFPQAAMRNLRIANAASIECGINYFRGR
jgi:hypothetical protein